MTLDEFINKLSRLRHRRTGRRLSWVLGPEGEICCGSHSPITAIAKAEGKGHFFPSQVWSAGYALGLTGDLLRDIYCAADNSPSHKKNLRLQLLTACGLMEGTLR